MATAAPRHEVATMQDLANLATEENFVRLARDLKLFLGHLVMQKALLQQAASNRGIDTPPLLVKSMVWIDDHASVVNSTLSPEGGKPVVELTTSPDKPVLSWSQIEFATAPLETLDLHAKRENNHFFQDGYYAIASRLGLTERPGYWFRPEEESDPESNH
jgi:hypothetical protein